MPQSTTKPKRQPLAVRLSALERKAIEAAATHLQESLSEFLRTSAKQRAKKILRDLETNS